MPHPTRFQLDLPFRDSGGGLSPPLLLVHALGADRRMWTGFSGALDPARRTIAVDLYGAGAAPRFRRPPGLDDHTEALLRLIDRLQIDRVVPVGCAVGSMIACALAARIENRAAAVILANPILRMTPEAGEMLQDRVRRIREHGIGAIAAQVLDRAFSGADNVEGRTAFGEQFLEQTAEGYADLATGIVGCDISGFARALQCPVLVCPGSRDAVLPSWHGEELLGLLRDGRCAPVDGGHFVPQQAPAQFAATVSAFLAGMPGQSGG